MIGSSPAFAPMMVSGLGSRRAHRVADLIAHCDHVLSRRCLALTEHRHLQRRSVSAQTLHAFPRGGLNNEVDMSWRGVRMRPQADIDLFGPEHLGHRYGHTPKQWAQLRALVLAEVSHVYEVPERLDDQRSNTERSNTVLDDPVCSLVDPAAWSWPSSRREIAGEAPFLVRVSVRHEAPPLLVSGQQRTRVCHPLIVRAVLKRSCGAAGRCLALHMVTSVARLRFVE
jgi:hypothetical protein